MSKRYKILVVGKNDKYQLLFEGLRKNKFAINFSRSFSSFSESELTYFNMFFIVIYEPRDVFELLRVYKENTPIVVASNNLNILKKMKNFSSLTLIDLSKNSTMIGVWDALIR